MTNAKTDAGTSTVAAALRELLDLLAAEAPAEQLAGPAARTRAAHAHPREQEAVDDATRTALAIHRTLTQRRRREAELAALFDTAGDLAALRDPDAVLRAIVHRARTLLNTDVAYLTLNDPAAGDTFMRVTAGSVSARFQQLRLGMGEGLGGLVAQTARPYASADYRTDRRFKHTGAIDAGVGEEGLVGILGVPLRVGRRVIGVLFAADRTSRDFAPEAIALLASLADHAAVAIDGARLLEETRSALVELNAANETARAHSEALHRAADAHDRLTDLVLRGGGVDDVAREIAALLGGNLAVHDADGTELARLGTGAAVPSEQGIQASRRGGRAVPVEGSWVCAALAGPELLGSLVLTGRAGLTAADQRLFERAALVTALLLLLRRSVAEAEDRVRGELLDDLLTGHPPGSHRDTGSMTLRARKLDVHLSRPHAVLVLGCEPDLRPRLLTEAARRARLLGGLAGVRDGCAVLLVPTTEPGPLARELAQDLGRAIGAPVTAGPPVPPPAPSPCPAPTTRRAAVSKRWRSSTAPARARAWRNSASSACCWATGPTSPDTWTGSSARSSTTTPGAAPNSPAPSTPTMPTAPARPGPRTRCTSTSTPWSSASTGSPSSSARTGTHPAGRLRSSSPCGCTTSPGAALPAPAAPAG